MERLQRGLRRTSKSAPAPAPQWSSYITV